MPDNPLLPQDRLRELHALMLRIREMERRLRRGKTESATPSSREALLAATLLHLRPGDLLSASANDRTLRELSPHTPGGGNANHDLPVSLRLPLCAGAARGMQAAGVNQLTLAHCDAQAHEPLWTDALAWAHRDQLPLILLCADTQKPVRASRTRPHAPPLTWPAVVQLAHKLRLPLFPVDGYDAVAVYRVMQEITTRARNKGGPSIVWAALSSTRLGRRDQPIARLEAYASARNISLRS